MELRADGVTVSFEGREALKEVTLAVRPGEHVGLCGAPSSGKTTLLKLLAGLVRPARGRVLWDGEDVWALSPEARRDRQAAFGMIFQTDALFDSSTVLQNVTLPLQRRGRDRAQAEARAREVLGEVGLQDASGLLPDQLSGGMRKRAGIARALAASPGVLLADDPLAGLDPFTAEQVAQLLLRASKDRTLLLAQPDPSPHLDFDRWLLLEGGRVAYDGPYDARRLERT